jgi:hypothetical protein
MRKRHIYLRSIYKHTQHTVVGYNQIREEHDTLRAAGWSDELIPSCVYMGRDFTDFFCSIQPHPWVSFFDFLSHNLVQIPLFFPCLSFA